MIIKRVVSSFILTKDLRIAVFLRRSSLPTFPSHWAACSGSIETGETPYEAAKRELYEETNLKDFQGDPIEPERMHGLYVDAPLEHRTDDGSDSPSASNTVFRVYPFIVHMPDDHILELKGTEHDKLEFVTISELEVLQPTVPMLAQAFHHASFGRYLQSIPPVVRDWADNRHDGAMSMARQAVQLLQKHPDVDPAHMKMLRPTMVAITNVLDQVAATGDLDRVLKMVEEETKRAIELAVGAVLAAIQNRRREQELSSEPMTPTLKSVDEEFRIATFSRSSTLATVLNRVQESFDGTVAFSAACSRSSPGDEGVGMANDLQTAYNDDKVNVADDDELLNTIQIYHLVLIGCDCVMPSSILNKIGTKRLVQAASDKRVPVYCCADKFKLWDDAFPPPLEDIFEIIPRESLTKMIIPDSKGEQRA